MPISLTCPLSSFWILTYSHCAVNGLPVRAWREHPTSGADRTMRVPVKGAARASRSIQPSKPRPLTTSTLAAATALALLGVGW